MHFCARWNTNKKIKVNPLLFPLGFHFDQRTNSFLTINSPSSLCYCKLGKGNRRNKGGKKK